VLNAQIIENLADGLVDKVINGLGVVVEEGNGGQDMGTQISGCGHELMVAPVQRGLPNQQNEFSFLF